MTKRTKQQKNKKNSSVQQDVEVVVSDQPVDATVETTANANEMTPEQVEATIDELAATPKRQRIWEIDFLRGLMILFVVWDHFMWSVRSLGAMESYNTHVFQWLNDLSIDYATGALRSTTHDTFVTMFVLTSGISCSFSRSNGKRALKMCAFAILFSAVTYAASAIFNDKSMIMYFNVIHVVALSVLIYTAIEWIWGKLTKNWQKNIFGVLFFALTMTALVVGHCAKYNIELHSGYPYSEGIGAYKYNWVNLMFGEKQWVTNIVMKFRSGGDYLSFLPDFGWFLVGAFLGKVIYREKKTVFPSVNPKYVIPFTFCGKYSLWVYFISEAVMYGLIYLLHIVVPWL